MAIDKITASGLGDGGVSTADLADGAVTTAKITDGEVTFAKLNADAQPTPTQVSDQPNTSTGGFSMPAGTTAQRPGTPDTGESRYNSETGSLEFYDGANWITTNLIPTVDSVSGTIYNGIASDLTLSLSNATDSIDVVFKEGVTTLATVSSVSVSSGSATVTVPSEVYGQTVGDTITININNTDGTPSSNSQTKTVIATPTGGTITSVGGDRVHTFTTSSSFVVPAGISLSNVDFLVLAGGGGGGTHNAGGGGAGGLRTSFGSTSGGGASAQSAISTMGAATYTVVVGPGAGRKGDAGNGRRGDSGTGSSISGSGITTISTSGGGGGCSGNDGTAGLTGGCGGAGYNNGNNGQGTTGEGYAGGAGNSTQDIGGGGGTAALGQDGSDGNYAGDGGAGLQVNIDGNNYYWGGGGGGAGYEPSDPSGDGGIGGGGGGAGGDSSPGGAGGGSAINSGAAGNSVSQTGGQGGDGGANSGGGGGGTSRPGSYGGAGGKGIVILRYTLS
jgi:hypothetical protein